MTTPAGVTGLASLSALTLSAISVEGTAYSLGATDLSPLHEAFARYFGGSVTPQDLIDTFEKDTGLALRSLSLSPVGEDRFETRATFRGASDQVEGACAYVWQREAEGFLRRTHETSFETTGSQRRLALLIHGNLLNFAKKSGIVREFFIEARGVGRYAYRFMDGVVIDPALRQTLGERLAETAVLYGIPFDRKLFESIRSPREISDFIVLRRIPSPWMALVDEIVAREGYNFTVDQVVDVARRPGLAHLIGLPSYRMRLDLNDEGSLERFRESIHEGRGQRSLQRIRGVLGSPYPNLPPNVRNALVVFRPYLFPQPRETPPIPDLTSYRAPADPYQVRGFRSRDGEFLESIPVDPEGVPLRDYRSAEVRQVVDAIEDGRQVITATGLSASGKTEALIWNLERVLSSRGHRVVALDAMRIGGGRLTEELLTEIDRVIQPTVLIFDESVYITGSLGEVVSRFARRFLSHPGQHIVFVGGGVTSPERQRREITTQLAPLWADYPSAHVSLMPKPVNLTQAWRFLGFGRIDWADEAAKIGLLLYILERYPPYFVPIMPIRLHEYPDITNLAGARLLIDSEVDPAYWAGPAQMVLGRDSPLRPGSE